MTISIYIQAFVGKSIGSDCQYQACNEIKNITKGLMEVTDFSLRVGR